MVKKAETILLHQSTVHLVTIAVYVSCDVLRSVLSD